MKLLLSVVNIKWGDLAIRTVLRYRSVDRSTDREEGDTRYERVEPKWGSETRGHPYRTRK